MEGDFVYEKTLQIGSGSVHKWKKITLWGSEWPVVSMQVDVT